MRHSLLLLLALCLLPCSATALSAPSEDDYYGAGYLFMTGIAGINAIKISNCKGFYTEKAPSFEEGVKYVVRRMPVAFRQDIADDLMYKRDAILRDQVSYLQTYYTHLTKLNKKDDQTACTEVAKTFRNNINKGLLQLENLNKPVQPAPQENDDE